MLTDLFKKHEHLQGDFFRWAILEETYKNSPQITDKEMEEVQKKINEHLEKRWK